jgi:hypothetical protein
VTYHQHATVTVGDGVVTIERPSGQITCAAIIHAREDSRGRLVYAMLDRVVHEKYTGYGDWTMAGCFVTEMTRTVEDSMPSTRGRVGSLAGAGR